MKITDINCEIGINGKKMINGKRTVDEIGLIEEMNKYNIDHCVAFSSYALMSYKEGNKQIKEISGKSNGRISHCYVLGPNLSSSQLPSSDELIKQLKIERPSAVKLFPNRGAYVLNSFYSGELLDILNELSLPLLLDVDEIPAFDKLPELAISYPQIKFVLLRVRYGMTNFIKPLITKTKNIFFETSIMIDTQFIDEIVNKTGSERLIFGSGMPSYDPTGALSMIIYGDFNEHHKQNILSANWDHIQEGIKWE